MATHRAQGQTINMKALSLTQPWASLVALGLKKYETRSWRTNYRGILYIHAAKTFPAGARRFAEVEVALGRLPSRIPFGAIIAVVKLVDIYPTQEIMQDISALERLYGDYSWGRFAWRLAQVETIEPIPYKGSRGLFDVEMT